MDNTDKKMIRLLLRSKDNGNGWRNVSNAVWPLIERIKAKELFEIEESEKRIRLSTEGKIVAKYLLN
jgi:hypothetical protein